MRRATGGCQGRFSVLCTFNLEIVWEMLHWNLATASPGLATYKKFQNSRLFTDSTKNHMCVECFIVIDFIRTEGALRLPTTYDNHSNPIPSHPSVHPSTNLATFGLHSGYILATFWPQSDYILTTFCLHSDYILIFSDYIPIFSDYFWLTDWLTVLLMYFSKWSLI